MTTDHWSVGASMAKKQRWSRWYDKCQSENCTTPDKPHHGKGLCTTCYYRQYERKAPAKRTDGADSIRQEMYLAIVRLYRELRTACPVKYSDGVLTVSVGKAQRSHEFGEGE